MISGNRRPYFDREFSVSYIDFPSVRYAVQSARQDAAGWVEGIILYRFSEISFQRLSQPSSLCQDDWRHAQKHYQKTIKSTP